MRRITIFYMLWNGKGFVITRSGSFSRSTLSGRNENLVKYKATSIIRSNILPASKIASRHLGVTARSTIKSKNRSS